jgi:hypothetical protein
MVTVILPILEVVVYGILIAILWEDVHSAIAVSRFSTTFRLRQPIGFNPTLGDGYSLTPTRVISLVTLIGMRDNFRGLAMMNPRVV